MPKLHSGAIIMGDPRLHAAAFFGLLMSIIVFVGTAQARELQAAVETPSNLLDCGLPSQPTSTYTVVQGDTPKTVVLAVYAAYPLIHWHKLWSLIAACNSNVLLPPSSSTPPRSPRTAGTSKRKSKKDQLQAGISLVIPAVPAGAVISGDFLPKHSKHKEEHPVLKQLCGCTDNIPITAPATWQDVIRAAYPEEKMAAYAALLLRMCNREAKVEENTDGNMLSPGQTLRGICLTVQGLSFEAFLGKAQAARAALKDDMAAAAAAAEVQPSGAAPAVIRAPEPSVDEVTAASTTCAISWSSNAHVRDVTLTNSCPVYTNACSGPSDTLSYQNVLTPCCQAHDWCYSCAWRVGWTGTSGKEKCDYLFLDNLYKTCDVTYPHDAWNRGKCRLTAETMYSAVSLAPQSYFTSETCPGESWKLSNTAFCFNPIYTLDGITAYVRPGNGQSWGSWTNFARCPVSPAMSWASGINARVEAWQGPGDDTALNAIRMACSDRAGIQTAIDVRPHDGWWGDWRGYSYCPAGRHITAIRMQVEKSLGWSGDDTAANTLQARCSDGTVLSHPNHNWGTFSDWVSCPAGSAVCGLKVKMEQKDVTDDTALTDLEVACCTKG